VAPAVGEVVLVEEALAGSKAEIGEANLMGVVAEAEAASVADAVFASVGHEAVEVVVAPRESELQESGTKCGRSSRQIPRFRRRHEGWVPAAEVSGQVVVERPGTDLEQEVCTSRDQRICCFFTIRLLTTWLTADSTKAFEIASPQRWRSP